MNIACAPAFITAPDSEKDDPKAKDIYDQLQKANANQGEKGKQLTMREKEKKMENGKWNVGSLDVVKHNMYYTGYPKDHIHFVKGEGRRYSHYWTFA